jgi:predicted negative regulator of RcsB-dependent stress response
MQFFVQLETDSTIGFTNIRSQKGYNTLVLLQNAMQTQELMTLKEAAQHLAVVVDSQNQLAAQLVAVTTMQSKIIDELVDTLAQLVEEIRRDTT